MCYLFFQLAIPLLLCGILLCLFQEREHRVLLSFRYMSCISKVCSHQWIPKCLQKPFLLALQVQPPSGCHIPDRLLTFHHQLRFWCHHQGLIFQVLFLTVLQLPPVFIFQCICIHTPYWTWLGLVEAVRFLKIRMSFPHWT